MEEDKSKELNKLTKADLVAMLIAQGQTGGQLDSQGDNRPQNRSVTKIRIDYYSGVSDDIDATDWIELYDLLTDEASWADTQKIRHLPSYLKGNAAKWYFSTIKGHILTWTVVMELFKSQFGACDRPSLAYINNLVWNHERDPLSKYYQDK